MPRYRRKAQVNVNVNPDIDSKRTDIQPTGDFGELSVGDIEIENFAFGNLSSGNSIPI